MMAALASLGVFNSREIRTVTTASLITMWSEATTTSTGMPTVGTLPSVCVQEA
ncbi:hypothetical protein VD0002_g1929 [Verticillium dahliae]|uniref:Uncharacterized protein n=1 Tax=Verticillium dahliae TaxID=27337 RepID=A0AA45ANB5_VERDA|nr:hypothetical protein BJF96_g3709 [Verticillium dahliae]PNH39630.1 hypothetical protein VD0004_g7270 [Verticillium dahliae]PNH50406.1 hypothetical protein VD0003_g6782 [Verticillium dahliae]PNH67968.1 hypothetical protein VD0002_g1929 [Verticillium dahliae]PNH69380.1 hypothetical protein VD0001_g7203 [Verticillium dahliae]